MTQRNWTADQLRFMEWLALPKRLRSPKTQRLLAVEIGVGEDTLSDWKRFEGFLDAVNALAKQHLKATMPDVLDAVARRAISGNMIAAKLALQIEGMLQETLNLNVNKQDIKNMSDDELEQIVNGGKGE